MTSPRSRGTFLTLLVGSDGTADRACRLQPLLRQLLARGQRGQGRPARARPRRPAPTATSRTRRRSSWPRCRDDRGVHQGRQRPDALQHLDSSAVPRSSPRGGPHRRLRRLRGRRSGINSGNGSLNPPAAGRAGDRRLPRRSGQVEGSTGCNAFSGPYTVNGDVDVDRTPAVHVRRLRQSADGDAAAAVPERAAEHGDVVGRLGCPDRSATPPNDLLVQFQRDGPARSRTTATIASHPESGDAAGGCIASPYRATDTAVRRPTSPHFRLAVQGELHGQQTQVPSPSHRRGSGRSSGRSSSAGRGAPRPDGNRALARSPRTRRSRPRSLRTTAPRASTRAPRSSELRHRQLPKVARRPRPASPSSRAASTR